MRLTGDVFEDTQAGEFFVTTDRGDYWLIDDELVPRNAANGMDGCSYVGPFNEWRSLCV